MRKASPLTISRVTVSNFGFWVTMPSGPFCRWLLTSSHSLMRRITLTAACARIAIKMMIRIRIAVDDSCTKRSL